MNNAVVRDLQQFIPLPSLFILPLLWVLCWYGKATVNRRDAGSIPATAAGYEWKSSGWKQGPAADRRGRKEARAAVAGNS